MPQRARWNIAAGILALTAALTPGGVMAQQATSVVVIGCLEQRQGEFLIKDFRNGAPYRLDASAKLLGWHVGHQLEVHGTLEPGSSSDATLKVDKVIYISTTCSPPAK